MRNALAALVLAILPTLSGCATSAAKPSWVPAIAPDGIVYEAEIAPGELPGQPIVCLIVAQDAMQCLVRHPDGAYQFAVIPL